MSGILAYTIDRMLTDQRLRMTLRGRSRTKPGSLLKHHIPIRAFVDWNNAFPRFAEIDLVAHDVIAYIEGPSTVAVDTPRSAINTNREPCPLTLVEIAMYSGRLPLS